MFIADLEHLEVLNSVQNLADSLCGANLLLLSIKDGILSLALGDVSLYSGPLTGEVTGIQMSVEDIPGVQISTSSQFGSGDIRNSAFASASMQGSGSAFASASTSASSTAITSTATATPVPVFPMLYW
jgi:hypothetical protein